MAQLTRWQALQISGKHRLDWYEAMATTLGDGKSAFVVVKLLAAEYTRIRHPMAPLLQELARRMEGNRGGRMGSGTIGSDLLGLVPPDEANLIDAGESAGKLHEGFLRAAEFLRKNTKLREEVLGPLKEPGILLLMLAGVLVFFSMEILPTFNDIAPRHTWPSGARMYGGLADKAIGIAVGIVVLMIFGTWGFMKASANWRGPTRATFDKVMFPFTLVTRVNSAAMLTALSGYVAAGVKFDAALEQLQANATPYMRSIYTQLRAHLGAGMKPEDAICKLHIVDPGYHWMIRLYGDSTDFAGAMRRISDELVTFATIKARSTFSKVNFMLKVLVAGFIVWTMLSLFGIVQAVKATAQQVS